MDAGERWALANVLGQPAYAWDSRGNRVRPSCDLLQRPTDVFLCEDDGPERLVGRTVYGESLRDAEARNARGKSVQQFDQAGVASVDEYDFKGNVLTSRRQLAQDYKNIIDWSGSVPLESEIYVSHSRFDALNRPFEVTAPDASVVRQTFNEDNLLENIERICAARRRRRSLSPTPTMTRRVGARALNTATASPRATPSTG